MLSEIIPLIQKVTERENLTAAETEKAFSILTKEDVDAYYFLVFLAALHAKGETADGKMGSATFFILLFYVTLIIYAKNTKNRYWRICIPYN